MGTGNDGVDDGNKVRQMGENLSKIKLSRTRFLTTKPCVTVIYLRKKFTKALIFNYFDPKYYIWIKTDKSSFAIGGIICWLTSKHRTHINPDLSTFKVG